MLLTDPNVVFVILLVGLWASSLAIYIPGTGLWEVLALGVLAGALYLLSTLPTNWLAVLALVVGTLDFLMVPLVSQRLAAMALAGLILQVVGGLGLFDGLSVSWITIAATVGVSFAFYQYVLIPARAARIHPPAMGDERQLPGAVGRVVMPLTPVGTVNVHGELWTAYSDRPLQEGDVIIVIEKEGLRLHVEKVKAKRTPDDSGEVEHGSG